MAYDTHEKIFLLDDVIEQQSMLSDGHQLLLDRSTQRDFGPSNGRQFTDDNGFKSLDRNWWSRVLHAGLFKLGTGLALMAPRLSAKRVLRESYRGTSIDVCRSD